MRICKSTIVNWHSLGAKSPEDSEWRPSFRVVRKTLKQSESLLNKCLYFPPVYPSIAKIPPPFSGMICPSTFRLVKSPYLYWPLATIKDCYKLMGVWGRSPQKLMSNDHLSRLACGLERTVTCAEQKISPQFSPKMVKITPPWFSDGFPRTPVFFLTW